MKWERGVAFCKCVPTRYPTELLHSLIYVIRGLMFLNRDSEFKSPYIVYVEMSPAILHFSQNSHSHTHWNESPFSLLKWRDLMIHFDCSVKTFAVCGGHTDRFNCPYSVHFSVDSLLAIWAWQVPQLLFSEAFWLKHHRFVLLFCLNSFLSVFVWLMGNEVFYHI